jgi:hypothetical protein
VVLIHYAVTLAALETKCGAGSLRFYVREPLNNTSDEAMISLHFANVSPLGKTDITFMYTIIFPQVRVSFQWHNL